MGKFHGYHIRRIEDVELLLPSRMQLEPKPGDNPLHRPYPEHAKDMKILRDLLAELNEPAPEHKYIDRDLRLRIPPHGILFFHALDIKDLVLSQHHFQKGSPFCVYVELECQDTIKCSDPVYSCDLDKVRIDHSIHLFIELSEFRMDERNEFYVHIYAFQDPEHQHLIGSQKLHMYDFVRDIHGISKLRIINELSYCVGKLSYEFAWAYGSFGYGFSNQLVNTKTDLFENICHSMFPRIKLGPDDLVDNKLNARIPNKLRLVTLHSLLLRQAKEDPALDSTKAGAQLRGSIFGNKGPDKDKKGQKGGSDYHAKSLIFRRVKFCRGSPIHVSLNLDIHQKFMEDDFNNSYGEYLCLRNRRDRLTWLTKLTEGRLRDKVEYEATELFKPFNEVREVRRTLTLKRPLGAPPALVEYTDRQRQRLCNPVQPLSRVTGEDEKWDPKFVQEKLASAPRQSGYLAYVFGYEKPPPPDEDLKKFEFKVNRKAAKQGCQVVKDRPGCCTRFCLCIVWCFYKLGEFLNWICDFICPSFDRVEEDRLPEISVTMPSPEHSTTDFHSFCTQKQIFDKESDLDMTRRRTQAYIQMARKTRNPEMDLDDFEEFLVPSKAYIGERRSRKEGLDGGGGDEMGGSQKDQDDLDDLDENPEEAAMEGHQDEKYPEGTMTMKEAIKSSGGKKGHSKSKSRRHKHKHKKHKSKGKERSKTPRSSKEEEDPKIVTTTTTTTVKEAIKRSGGKKGHSKSKSGRHRHKKHKSKRKD